MRAIDVRIGYNNDRFAEVETAEMSDTSEHH